MECNEWAIMLIETYKNTDLTRLVCEKQVNSWDVSSEM